MNTTELFPIDEGRNDRFTFKAVFMAGTPGSGKTSVAKTAFAGTGMKFCDVDSIWQMFKSANKDITHGRIADLEAVMRKNYIDGRLGLIIDGTARDFGKIKQMKTELESLGYETCMVFVATSLAVAKERASEREQRTGRPVTTDFIEMAFKQIRAGFKFMKTAFASTLFVIDNTASPLNIAVSEKKIAAWLKKPVDNAIAKQWLGFEEEPGAEEINVDEK